MPESKQERIQRRRTKERLRENVREIKRQQNIDLDVRVDGDIDHDKLRSYTMSLFEEQAKQTETSAKNQYAKNPIAWMQSASSRARLVIIEAKDSNAKQLAGVVMNASPLERVLVVGLEGSKREIFEAEMRSLWVKKLDQASPIYKQNFIEHFGRDPAITSTNELIKELSLKDLLGPHIESDSLDISFDKLSDDFPHFEVPLEEILCFGHTDELSLQLGPLALKKGLPYLPVKSEASEDDSLHLWRAYSKNETTFLEQIASGKSAPDMLGENVALSTSFEASFDLNAVKERMTARGGISKERIENLQQQDVDYLKSLFVQEAMYPANTSPVAITKTISKATSKLGAMGAEKVGKALVWNLVNRPVSTAEGVHFAVGSMTLDGGNDIIKEELDRKSCV